MDNPRSTSPEEFRAIAENLRRQARDIGSSSLAERARKALLAEECERLASKAERERARNTDS